MERREEAKVNHHMQDDEEDNANFIISRFPSLKDSFHSFHFVPIIKRKRVSIRYPS